MTPWFFRPRTWLAVLLLLGVLPPVRGEIALAQSVTCDDFTSQRAAQAVLEADPDTASELDPDGDEIACNHEEEPASEDSSEDEESTGDSAVDIVTLVTERVEEIEASFDAYDDLASQYTEARRSQRDEIAAEMEPIATAWTGYAEELPDLEFPPEAEDLEEAYGEFTALVAAAGEAWLELDADDLEGDRGFDEFEEAYAAAKDGLEPVQSALESTGEDTPASEPEGDLDAWVASVQSELDAFMEESDRFNDILRSYTNASESEQDDMIDEVFEIMAHWQEYADRAEELGPAPAGGEDLEAAYLEFAGLVTDAGEAMETWLTSSEDESDDLYDSFASARGEARRAGLALQEEIDGTSP